ncbi:MAG: hypothetical protein ACK5S2_05815 [Lysobacteraceae bacterium]|jgi:hypothetical protein|nr:hypothetical protein [Silanimonas sp.]
MVLARCIWCVALLVLMAPSPAGATSNAADSGHEHDRELWDAVRRVIRANLGRVLSAERVQYEGREIIRIKVIDDNGRVRVYTVEPQGDSKRESEPESH